MTTTPLLTLSKPKDGLATIPKGTTVASPSFNLPATNTSSFTSQRRNKAPKRGVSRRITLEYTGIGQNPGKDVTYSLL